MSRGRYSAHVYLLFVAAVFALGVWLGAAVCERTHRPASLPAAGVQAP